MRTRFLHAGFLSDAASAVSRWWQGLRVSWYLADKEPWIFVAVLVLIAAAFVFALRATYARQDERRSLACLAAQRLFRGSRRARGGPARRG